MPQELVPGMLVRHPTQADWGLGQIQSVVGSRVTVNFEHIGKVLIDASIIELNPAGDASQASAEDDPSPSRF